MIPRGARFSDIDGCIRFIGVEITHIFTCLMHCRETIALNFPVFNVFASKFPVFKVLALNFHVFRSADDLFTALGCAQI